MTKTTSTVLVDPNWLAEHLSDPDLRVVEVDVSASAYTDWHIEGAVLWNVYTDLKDDDYRLAEPPRLEALLARSGIRPESTIVFYGYAPAFAFWLMKLNGHEDVRILDCSREAWHSAGDPTTSITSPASPAGGRYVLGRQDSRLRADLAAVRIVAADTAGSGAELVDVRSAAEYAGECFWPSGGMQPGGRAGHVPSAIHQPLGELYDQFGAFRTPAELRRIFAATDLDGDADLVTYCTIGGRAATAWFVLTYLLGRSNVRVYDGSWAEWGRRADTPIETIAVGTPA